jgi:hypothetical protein
MHQATFSVDLQYKMLSERIWVHERMDLHDVPIHSVYSTNVVSSYFA